MKRTPKRYEEIKKILIEKEYDLFTRENAAMRDAASNYLHLLMYSVGALDIAIINKIFDMEFYNKNQTMLYLLLSLISLFFAILITQQTQFESIFATEKKFRLINKRMFYSKKMLNASNMKKIRKFVFREIKRFNSYIRIFSIIGFFYIVVAGVLIIYK